MISVDRLLTHPGTLFFLGAVFGLCMALIVGTVRGRGAGRERARRETEWALLQQQSTEQAQRLQQKNQLIESLRSEAAIGNRRLTALVKDNAVLETRLDEERKQTAEKIAVLQEARRQLSTEFHNLAQNILEEKSRKFASQNHEHLGRIVNPLRDQISDFKKKVEDVYDRESKDRVALSHQINSLKDLNERISQDAINLTNALKGQVKTQGNWGEMILERVLEQSGLVKGREYEAQASFENATGKKGQPDVVVHLPEEKDVVIDAKVSLVAYQRFCQCEIKADRDTALRQHITSIRNHVKGLSARNYGDLKGLRSLDFVLLFIPIETAFIVAVEHDVNLFKEAFTQNIVLVSPSTLLATLRTIEHIWRCEHQSRNAQTIAKRAGDLYDKFVNFTSALEEIGSTLGKARQAYDTAHKRLVSGKGSLISRAQTLKELGATTRKALPETLLEESRRP